MTRSREVLYIAKVAIRAALYFAAGRLGLHLGVAQGNVTPVWPPAGIALAALLLYGYRLWPGVEIGAFLVTVSTGAPLASAGGVMVGNTLKALVGASLLHSVVGFRVSLVRFRDILGIVCLAAVLSTTVGATVGVANLSLGAAASWADYGALWSESGNV